MPAWASACIGIVSASAYQTETIAALKPGETIEIGGYTLLFQGTAPATGPNYREERALFIASRGGGEQFPLAPAKRFYETRQMATTEAAIETIGFSQLYVSLGEPHRRTARVAVRASYKPLVTLIWLGAARDGARRRAVAVRPAARIGAPRRGARRRAEAAPT